jgi:hypothetical protein
MPLNRTIFNPSLYQKVQSIWFHDLPKNVSIPPEELVKTRWFPRDPAVREEFDGVCKDNFEHALLEIGPGKDVKAISADLAKEIEVRFPKVIWVCRCNEC